MFQQRLDASQLARPSDETCHRRWQVGRRCDGQRSRRREVRDQAGRAELEEPFGLGQVAQAVDAEIAKRGALWKGVADKGVCHVRNDDLAAPRSRRDARRAMNVDAGVVAPADDGLAGVDTHPHLQVCRAWPIVGGDGALSVYGGGHCLPRGREHRKHANHLRSTPRCPRWR